MQKPRGKGECQGSLPGKEGMQVKAERKAWAEGIPARMMKVDKDTGV